jgi:hypothetical protein
MKNILRYYADTIGGIRKSDAGQSIVEVLLVVLLVVVILVVLFRFL